MISENAENILTVEKLSVALDGQEVLRDISFAVNKGEAVAVIGPNGAGKTILFRALLGLVPHKGKILWKPGIKTGYVPQRFFIDRDTPMTALEFCLLTSPSFWRPSAEFLARLKKQINAMGLNKSILGKRTSDLSGGELQRLLIAWAMLYEPDILLLDEPTVAVDVSFQSTIYDVLDRLRTENKIAILLISHDISIVYRHAERVLCLNKSILCQGTPAETLTQASFTALYGATGYYNHAHGGSEK